MRTKEGSRLAWALLAAAAVLITAGALNGGLRDVLAKAVSICTECIGLG
ncbi:MAG: thioredoxin [Clostridia bacterium]|nr:thioredoxin [Clostridia bacterium]